MYHTFEADVAMKVGVNAAILLQNLVFWCKKNEANDVNYHDGLYWTFNSTKAFCELFPYFTQKQIRHALEHLIDGGYVLSGNYNENRYNRTLWYAVTDAGYKLFPSSCLNSKIDSPNRESRFDKFGKCKTDINTDNKPDSKPDNPPVVINNDTPQGDGAKANDPDKPTFETFWSAYPRHTNKATARKAWEKLRLTSQEYASLLRAIEAQKQSPQWQRDDGQYIPHPSTWLNQRRWEDELPAAQQTTTCTGDNIPVFDEEDMSRYGGKPVPRDWRKPWTGDE